MSSSSPSSVPNRWAIAIAAFLLQLALGSVYAWSVFLPHVIDLYHVSKVSANATFSITLVALGVTAGFGGFLQSRFGPRVIASAGGLLYGLGLILAGVTTNASSTPNLFVLYLTYGVIGGIGIGLGYIVPLAMLIKWFPDRRGFITGLAVAGFGLGALFTAQIASPLVAPKGIGLGSTLLYMGIVYLVIVVAAAQFFRRAPEGFAPAGWTPSATLQANRSTRDFTLGEALRSPSWYLLWLILALNVTAGAALISVAAPLAHTFTGQSLTTVAIIVSTISIFNGLGRLFWGWVSDFIGRPYTFLCLFVIQCIVFAILPSINNLGVLLIPAAIIGLCYGGGFGTMPAFAADFFGAKNSGTIYGVMLTAWSAGGIVGPILIASFGTTKNPDYMTPLYIIAVIMLVSIVLPFVARVVARRRTTMVQAAAGR
ncbi:MAG TPA: OFA family MFS transporter [Ktedonobacteraceae bacterium]|nr:OFA family MFS transporter [Ktedonobacteraceae bacterium]